MTPPASLDAQVRSRLQTWPHMPPGLVSDPRVHCWLRGRPGARDVHDQPFLKPPGSGLRRTIGRTMPDGMWLGFGGSGADAYADVIVLEACGSMANLLDKRSRFAPSTQSVMVVCPLRWLRLGDRLGQPAYWELIGLDTAPTQPLIVPVRDVRVFYALKSRQYEGFLAGHVPHAHEFFLTMDALVAEHSDENPDIQALFARASASSNFMPVHCDGRPPGRQAALISDSPRMAAMLAA